MNVVRRFFGSEEPHDYWWIPLAIATLSLVMDMPNWLTAILYGLATAHLCWHGVRAYLHRRQTLESQAPFLSLNKIIHARLEIFKLAGVASLAFYAGGAVGGTLSDGKLFALLTGTMATQIAVFLLWALLDFLAHKRGLYKYAFDERRKAVEEMEAVRHQHL
jgi:hypothetical protein